MISSSSSSKPPIALGSDHAAFRQKETIRIFLESKGYTVLDLGTDSEEKKVDYPDFAFAVCQKVTSGETQKGILICGTGIGMSIAANKVPGIRCALCHDHYTAHMSREHNDANILAMGGRVTGVEVMKDMVEVFLTTEFSADPEGKHTRRLKKIKEKEE